MKINIEKDRLMEQESRTSWHLEGLDGEVWDGISEKEYSNKYEPGEEDAGREI